MLKRIFMPLDIFQYRQLGTKGGNFGKYAANWNINHNSLQKDSTKKSQDKSIKQWRSKVKLIYVKILFYAHLETLNLLLLNGCRDMFF